jgi:hypothetical protein
MALETVGMTAEKTKLETDCKEGSAELRVLEVTRAHTLNYYTTQYFMYVLLSANCVCFLFSPSQQECAMLEQCKACLLEKCKGILRRAREICNMDPGKSVVPPDLHTVSTVTLAHSIHSTRLNSFLYSFICVFLHVCCVGLQSDAQHSG